MAKVRIEDGWLDVRVSWLERVLLSEKARHVPLSSVESVNPHPALLDMLLYWTDQRGVWLGGATKYEGYLVPSTRNPNNTMSIQVAGEQPWYVELDDQEPVAVAAEIERCLGPRVRAPTPSQATRVLQAHARRTQGVVVATAQSELEDDDWDEELPMSRQESSRRDSGASPLETQGEPSPSRLRLRLHEDRDVSRLGGWLLATGAFGVLAGTTIVAAGHLPGLLAVGAGLACAIMGGLALALVAHHQG
ncbi:MAG: hypothetical protein QM778_12855 [Myxococcales bacterium]